MIKIKPFLKWAGNKYQCIETILSSLPPAKRLIEPFTGSGAIFMNSDYPSYLLAEKNADLVRLFKFLQHEGAVFIDYCARFFSSKNNCETRYYYFREKFNRTKDLRYRAALFLYLNRHGYNGLCRYNQQGFYNVPFGRYSKPYFPRLEMDYFYQKSQRAQFVSADFRHTFAQAEVGDLIYCDPPYVPLSSSANFSSYINKKFKEIDQIELADLAVESAARGITVIISNHDTEFTRHHYRQGKIISFSVPRFISCQASNRRAAQELVAIFSQRR
ncbi:DNA adenine methylase [Legionella lansingensis]|uniref:Site-specific DNA-methyltransferase (adenine-specific) n=1 Tax=Legionella lansingensis TaxID=45067 RepID=A0A0W0VPU0_9GAMM|nr:Dam family site-specific DNA-(adenine-N6)-methyltransferase [Legionella lansingensis]KTD22126.1 DNA adenine methylase [Legionella lansingensis]SNV54351.1 DNA adenine methylase [Legionella lansingensis]